MNFEKLPTNVYLTQKNNISLNEEGISTSILS